MPWWVIRRAGGVTSPCWSASASDRMRMEAVAARPDKRSRSAAISSMPSGDIWSRTIPVAGLPAWLSTSVSRLACVRGDEHSVRFRIIFLLSGLQ